jgi:hypothetical protein
MTAPEQPEQEPSTSAPPPPPEQTDPEEDESLLLPALLLAYVVYRTWRGSHDSIPLGWRQVVRLLKLRDLIGRALAMVAARALERERVAAGRAGDELWMHTDVAVLAGVDAGLQAIAEALIWNDHHGPGSGGAASQSRSGTDTFIPDSAPTLLANLAAGAAMNGAVFAAASAAGWTGKRWITQQDNRVRDTHVALGKGKAVPLNQMFVSPSGSRLRFPRDPRAPLAERANCRCSLRIVRR